MRLSADRFEREKNYSVTMYIAQELLSQKLIGKKEYEKFRELAAKKYNPIFS